MTLTKQDMVWLLALVIAPISSGISTTIFVLLVIYSTGNYLFNKKSSPLCAARIVASIFLLYFAYFFIISAWRANSLMMGYEAMEGNLPLLGMALYGFTAQPSTHNFSAKNIGKWATVAVLITVLCALVLYYLKFSMAENYPEVLHKTWAGDRLEMFSRNPLMFASMSLTLSCIAILGFEEKKINARVASTIILLLGWCVVFFLAQSRGAFVCAIFLGCLILWYTKASIKVIAVFLIIFTLLFFLLYFFVDSFASLVNVFLNRFETMIAQLIETKKLIESGTQTRLNMYQYGIKAWLEEPWFGYGYQNRFQAILPFLGPEYKDFRYGHIHNAFLNHLVAGGILGLLFFLLLLFLPFWLLYRFSPSSRDEKYFAWLIVMVMSIIGMTTAILGHYVHSNFYGALIMTLALLLSRNRQSRLFL